MTLLIVFISCVFTIFALYMTVVPFLASRRDQTRMEHLDEELGQIERLVARKTMLLQSLRDLEFEKETAKLAPRDYEKFRNRYELEAVAVMRQLDEIHGGRGWEEEIDRELKERLGDEPAAEEPAEEAPLGTWEGDGSSSEARDAVEDDDVKRNDEAAEVDQSESDEPTEESKEQESAPLSCVQCGTGLTEEDKFCSQCGTPVRAAEQPIEHDETTASAEASR